MTVLVVRAFIIMIFFQQVKLYATGEGPVVHMNSQEIDFGVIPVLSDSTRNIQLSNESLIPAHFKCEMVSFFLKWMPMLACI